MKTLSYRNFSLKAHRNNWRSGRPNSCQFELTFRCGLHCQHCYCDCYNKAEYIDNEASLGEVKKVLDRVFSLGAIWLSFSGGDPLARKDFQEIYSYAVRKGFLVTILTSGLLVGPKMISFFKKRPPFLIEVTLNAVSRDRYEMISGVRGSFEEALRGVELILSAKLPLRVKTQLTRSNLNELPRIKRFLEKRKLRSYLSPELNPRLDGDVSPYDFRVSPEEYLNAVAGRSFRNEPLCSGTVGESGGGKVDTRLFRCPARSGDIIYIDPYANLVFCPFIRRPRVSFLGNNWRLAPKKILDHFSGSRLPAQSKCRSCRIRDNCYNCPGKVFLATGRLSGRSDWFCRLAHLTTAGFTRSSRRTELAT